MLVLPGSGTVLEISPQCEKVGARWRSGCFLLVPYKTDQEQPLTSQIKKCVSQASQVHKYRNTKTFLPGNGIRILRHYEQLGGGSDML